MKEDINYFKTKYIKEESDNKNEEKTYDQELMINLKKETYYIEKNLERYIKYAKEYPDKEMVEVIRNVNCNIDYDFYTNVVSSNLDDGILNLVNKYHNLTDGYTPSLVTIPDKYSRAYNKKMQSVAYEHLKTMIDMAALDGIVLYDVSSYRSYSTQSTLYNNYVKRDGTAAADRYSARPGYSEHQTGLATDLNTASSSAHFENSSEFAWLKNNSYKYGFILRYPKDKEYLTGYKFEPWHYRYVGIDAATFIWENEITFEEYYAYFIDNK